MSDVVIRVENVSKEYRLGTLGHGTLYRDLQSGWARFLGREDPNTKIDHQSVESGLNERFWALKDVSFDVHRGEVVGIIGRNGAGKSTLLKILSRVTAPSSGIVKVKGRIASLLEVGTGFHPELTGRENIFLNGAILGMARREVEEKFDEIVQFAEIEKFIDTPVKRYSSGMYVRLAFAVAAHLEPEILLVDEVLAVGDAAFQKKCLGKMGDVAKEGRTVLFVSHNMAAIKSLCSRVIIVESGKNLGKFHVDEGINKYFEIFKDDRKNNLISLRRDRQGNGNLKIIEMWVTLRDGVKNESLLQDRSGLIFHLIIYSKYDTKNTRIAISVNHELKSCILWLDSNTFVRKLNINEGINYIKCILFENFSLGKGSYYLNVAVWDNGCMADYIKRAFYFYIVESDFFLTGKSPGGDASILALHEWQDGVPIK